MTGALTAFALTLLVAVLLSETVRRSVLSTAVLFLGVGFLIGNGGLHVVNFDGTGNTTLVIAELALFAVLFTDGMRVGARDLASAWRLSSRALLLGMPLAMIAIAGLVRMLTGISWLGSFLVGAVLSPTDPVFAAAIVGREEVPARLRRLLNVESGLNDGLALPLVLAFLAALGGSESSTQVIVGELVLGVVIGVAVPWLAVQLERTRFFSPTGLYEPLYAFAVGLTVLAVAEATSANIFLAAFAGGTTMATVSPALTRSFGRFGELVAELLKLAALLVFGARMTPHLLGAVGVSGWIVAVLVLVAVRPLTLGLSLMGSVLDRRERAVAAWFGPKGFASVVYGLLVLESGVGQAIPMFRIVAVTVLLSMVVHSSTDVPVVRWFRNEDEDSDRPEDAAERKPSGVPVSDKGGPQNPTRTG